MRISRKIIRSKDGDAGDAIKIRVGRSKQPDTILPHARNDDRIVGEKVGGESFLLSRMQHRFIVFYEKHIERKYPLGFDPVVGQPGDDISDFYACEEQASRAAAGAG